MHHLLTTVDDVSVVYATQCGGRLMTLMYSGGRAWWGNDIPLDLMWKKTTW
jgi:hypothetical protein